MTRQSGSGRLGGRPRGSAAGETRTRLLQIIIEEHRRVGGWPGRDWLARQLHLSPQAVSHHRNRLIDEHLLPAEARAVEQPLRIPVGPTIRVLGRSAAGRPSLSVEDPEPADLLNLLTRGASDVYALEVNGDSMSGPPHLLRPGEWVLVEPRSEAADGDVIVARVVDEVTDEFTVTIKCLAHDPDGQVVLLSSNPGMPPLRPRQVEVVGVVIASARRMR